MSLTKLLLITSEFPPQPGGIGTHAYNIATQLIDYEMDVQVLTDMRSRNGREESVFDKELTFFVHRIKRNRMMLISYAARIHKAINLGKQQDVIVLSGKFSLWTGGLLSLLFSKKMIAVIHGSELLLSNTFLRKYTSWCLKRFDHVIAVSNFTLSLVDHLKLKNPSVIPNGFKVMEHGHFRKEQPQKLSLITVGNVTQRKGQHNVIKALPLLKKQYPNVKYHIVGIPTNRDELESLAKKLEVEEHLEFHGRVSDEDKFILLKEASIFLMLSETTVTGDVEGFGIAILEANALGLPAIGSLGCGIEDAILEGKSGFLIPSNQPSACINAIEEILNNYEYYSSQAMAWTTNFEWPLLIQQYVTLIKEP